MTDVKLCIDCRFCGNYSSTVELSKCQHSSNTQVSLVSGERTISVAYCTDERHSTVKCGPEAKYFEPKRSLFQRLMSAIVRGNHD